MGKGIEKKEQRAEESHQGVEEDASPRTSGGGGSKLMSALKLVAASAVLLQAVSTYQGAKADQASQTIPDEASSMQQQHRRRLQSTSSDAPSYMEPLFDELKERRKLMEETPPEEVKYWFEYTGPLQVRDERGLIIFIYRCEYNLCLT